MKPIVRCVVVIAGLLTAEAAFSQEFKSQAAAAASQWDSAFNSGDASKVAQGYTKSAVILPAGGQVANIHLVGSASELRPVLLIATRRRSEVGVQRLTRYPLLIVVGVVILPLSQQANCGAPYRVHLKAPRSRSGHGCHSAMNSDDEKGRWAGASGCWTPMTWACTPGPPPWFLQHEGSMAGGGPSWRRSSTRMRIRS